MKNNLVLGMLFVLSFSLLFGNAFATDVSVQPIKPVSESKAFSQLSPSINQYFEEDLSSGVYSKVYSIVGATSVTVGTTQTYKISVVVPEPDQDYTDGYFETQYGQWALIDRNLNIIESGNIVEVFGVYEAMPSVTLPQNLGDYAIVSAITQIDSYYDFNTNKWVYGEEHVVDPAEVLNLETSVTVPIKPQPSGFSIWSRILASLQSILNLLFG